eukprot:TRINITY_DN1857_c0_g1_i1.p1 TRINITY_DN1857_c0_g1~~TRINITY_DN1857_c0_g1_i1.p1  ORF type:complete len:355 (-),score=73.24 TRINITY_DN1857_c0_g1_i1:104-1096(-)
MDVILPVFIFGMLCYVLVILFSIRGAVVLFVIRKRWKRWNIQGQFHVLSTICLIARMIHYYVLFLEAENPSMRHSAPWKLAIFWFLTSLVAFGMFMCFFIVAIYWVEVFQMLDERRSTRNLGSPRPPDVGPSQAEMRRMINKRHKVVSLITIVCISVLLVAYTIGILIGNVVLMAAIVAVFFLPLIAIVSFVTLFSYRRRIMRILTGPHVVITPDRKKDLKITFDIANVCVTMVMFQGISMFLFNIYLEPKISQSEQFIATTIYYLLLDALPLFILMIFLRPTLPDNIAPLTDAERKGRGKPKYVRPVSSYFAIDEEIVDGGSTERDFLI